MVTRNDDPPQENDSMSPQSEEVWGLLEEAGVDEALIEKVTGIIDQLAWAANRVCQTCEDRMLSDAYLPDSAEVVLPFEADRCCGCDCPLDSSGSCQVCMSEATDCRNYPV